LLVLGQVTNLSKRVSNDAVKVLQQLNMQLNAEFQKFPKQDIRTERISFIVQPTVRGPDATHGASTCGLFNVSVK